MSDCKDCPECVLVFGKDNKIVAIMPDSHSMTCQTCENHKEKESEYKLHIKPCCKDMGNMIMMNEFRQGIIEDYTLSPHHWIIWNDGDMHPLRFCPSCGKKIEDVRE